MTLLPLPTLPTPVCQGVLSDSIPKEPLWPPKPVSYTSLKSCLTLPPLSVPPPFAYESPASKGKAASQVLGESRAGVMSSPPCPQEFLGNHQRHWSTVTFQWYLPEKYQALMSLISLTGSVYLSGTWKPSSAAAHSYPAYPRPFCRRRANLSCSMPRTAPR